MFIAWQEVPCGSQGKLEWPLQSIFNCVILQWFHPNSSNSIARDLQFSLLQHDIDVVRLLRPWLVILEIGSNDLCIPHNPFYIVFIIVHFFALMWRLVVHGGIDGFSRILPFLSCSNNNKAQTVLKLFKDGVNEYGLPQRVRSDKGLENIDVCTYMLEKRGSGSKCFITGKSVHNQIIEWLWRDMNRRKLLPQAKR